MEVKAKLNKLRMAPRKVRLVVDVVRGMDAIKATEQLSFLKKRAAAPVLKLLNSAIANAENNLKLKKDNLYVKQIFVDEGFTLHRWKPRAMGRATPIQKKSSQVTIVLAEKVPTKAKSVSAKASTDKKEDLKIVSSEEIKQDMKKEDQERVEQKEGASSSRIGKFKEKFSLRKAGGE